MSLGETRGALLLALGLAVAGGLIGHGLSQVRRAERYVTVKGIAEREVRADVAIWPLRVVVGDHNLSRGQAQLEAGMAQIRQFLQRQGIDASSAQVQAFSVTDALANPYSASNSQASRYVFNQTLVVRANEPDKVMAATARIGELAAAGVVLSSGNEYGNGGPAFLFTGLNQLKPEMIAEATARAREAAEKFAHDAGSRVGGIRRANQGMFEILPRDSAPGITEESQVIKTVRVVTTVEYLLED
jgi:hypothetical protein